MKISRIIRTGLLAGVCVGLLSGCSWLEEWPPAEQQKAERAAPPTGPERVVKTSDGTWLAPEMPAQTAQTSIPAPVQGVNAAPVVPQTPVQPYNSISPAAGNAPQDVESRLAQLESQVSNIRNDISMMMPALTKLAEAQSEIQGLLSSLSDNVAAPKPQRRSDAAGAPMPLNNNNNNTQAAAMPLLPDDMAHAPQARQMAAVEPAAAPVPASPQPAAFDQSGEHTIISQMRLGEHPDKTRLVLDVSDNVAFSYDIDNAENVLMLELPGAAWAGADMPVRPTSNVVSYTAVPDGQGGTQMAIQLKQASQVLWAQYLPAAGGNGPRIVLDIAPL